MQRVARRTALAAASVLVMVVAGTGAGRTAPGHKHGNGQAGPKAVKKLGDPIARARAATARYVDDLDAATADGYRIITRMIPDMGYHFLNPEISEFDITQPPILVYVRDGDAWQLGALEWVFAEKPDTKPIPGAKYGSFGAACHYDDGTFVFEDDEGNCLQTSPETGTAFEFWHPDLVTLHLWAWYPNPDGIFSGTNRWVKPFNDETL